MYSYATSYHVRPDLDGIGDEDEEPLCLDIADALSCIRIRHQIQLGHLEGHYHRALLRCREIEERVRGRVSVRVKGLYIKIMVYLDMDNL
jgi:hypothetical protein